MYCPGLIPSWQHLITYREGLGSDDAQARKEAREALINLGSDGAPYIADIAMRRETSTNVRCEAITALPEVRFADPKHETQVYRDLFNDTDEAIWIAALDSLIKAGRPAENPILERVNKFIASGLDIRLRVKAARAAEVITPPAAPQPPDASREERMANLREQY